MHPELAAFLEDTGLEISDPIAEPEGAEYGAHIFRLGDRAVAFRVGKTTQTKVGQFVTVWRRSVEGPSRPIDTTDGIDLLVIDARQDARCGYFAFPRSVLVQRGVFSDAGRGGKRGFRVYPPWVTAPAGQAARTRAWQIECFTEAPIGGRRAAELFGASAQG